MHDTTAVVTIQTKPSVSRGNPRYAALHRHYPSIDYLRAARAAAHPAFRV